MTALDLRHLFDWVLIVVAVAAMFGGYYLLLEWLGDLAALRRSDTPEPERRRQLNSVLQFPARRIQ